MGYYYCPLLPLITTIILVTTFYLHYFVSLKFNCDQGKKTWIGSQTRTLYLIISFAATMVSAVFYIVTITVTNVKCLLGPFPMDEYPVYSSGLVTDDKSVSFWIFNATIWVGITGKCTSFR